MNSDFERSFTRDEKPTKKSYVSPRFLVYGNIQELTQTTGHDNVFDGMQEKTG